MKTHLLSLCFFLSTILFSSLSGQEYLLRYNPQLNKEYVMDYSTRTAITSYGEETTEAYYSTEARIGITPSPMGENFINQYRYKTLKMDMLEGDEVSNYDSTKEETMTTEETEEHEYLKPIFDYSFYITTDNLGNFLNSQFDPELESLSEIGLLHDMAYFISLPEEAVTKGTIWTQDEAAENGSTKITFTLDSINNELAVISFEGIFYDEINEEPFGTLSGKYTIFTKTGMTKDASMNTQIILGEEVFNTNLTIKLL